MFGKFSFFWEKKTKTMTFREHPQRVTLKTCDLRLDTWDTDYISDNCEQQYQQLHCDPWIKSDGDSIPNSYNGLYYGQNFCGKFAM